MLSSVLERYAREHKAPLPKGALLARCEVVEGAFWVTQPLPAGVGLGHQIPVGPWAGPRHVQRRAGRVVHRRGPTRRLRGTAEAATAPPTAGATATAANATEKRNPFDANDR